MLATRLAELDASGKPELPSKRISAHTSAGCAYRHLQAPAAAEERHARRKHGTRQLDLPFDVHAAIVDVQRRTGDRDAIVATESGAGRESHFGVCRPHDVAAHFGEALQCLRIALAGGLTAGGDLLRACRCAVAVDYENSGARHLTDFGFSWTAS